MIFSAIPKVWHLVGTWSEQMPIDTNLTGLSEIELMMVLHSIFIPLIFSLGVYFTLVEKNKSKRA
tara:strand:- start:869 stop:1063 length:195 start_codon:yes stop_codon:yes gene_type:complete